MTKKPSPGRRPDEVTGTLGTVRPRPAAGRLSRPLGAARLWLAVALLGVLSACVRSPFDQDVIAKNSDFLVLTAGSGDTLGSLAAQYLGDEKKGWVIAELNGIRRVKAGEEVVIPLKPISKAGMFDGGFQKIPILTYHRFTPGKSDCGRLAVSEDAFVAQMAYLRDRGFRVIDFKDLADFMAGNVSLPRRSVILSIDDGYKSVYEIAFPVLKRFDYPATIFVYSDFVGAGAGLTWKEMREMVDTGLIDIQPHSKTHSDLTLRLEGESEKAYRKRLAMELRHPAELIKRKLGLPIHTFSYPYGAENEIVIEAAAEAGYTLAATVTRGGNPTFAHPLVLRRTQIYCGDSLKTFARRLQTFEKISLK
ncbi:MAG: polysaccharide deacetylase family protein [Kiloniellales bacterium]|nr:polysaccharide deacetylase family protein [Kiloniellales bacterium]